MLSHGEGLLPESSANVVKAGLRIRQHIAHRVSQPVNGEVRADLPFLLQIALEAVPDRIEAALRPRGAVRVGRDRIGSVIRRSVQDELQAGMHRDLHLFAGLGCVEMNDAVSDGGLTRIDVGPLTTAVFTGNSA